MTLYREFVWKCLSVGRSDEIESSTDHVSGNIPIEQWWPEWVALSGVSEDVLLHRIAEELHLEVWDGCANRSFVDGFCAEWKQGLFAIPALPLSLENDLLTIVVCDPFSVSKLDWLPALSGYFLKCVLTTPLRLAAEIAHIVGVIVQEVRGDYNLKNHVFTDPSRWLEALIATAYTEGASDIHIEARRKGTVLRLRVDGMLRVKEWPTCLTLESFMRALKLRAGMPLDRAHLPQEGQLTVPVGLMTVVALRLSILPGRFGESVVIRILKGNRVEYTLSSLGMSSSQSAEWIDGIEQAEGLWVVCGPTGSGKTSTLYATLQALGPLRRKIISVEDPVECQISSIQQIPVKPAQGFTFANAIWGILRQSPEVIMIGEIRDQETAHAALQAALSGHKVLSTLHADEPLSVWNRMMSLQVTPSLMMAGFSGALGQRLLRCLCPLCKRQMDTSGIDSMFNISSAVWGAKGCPDCQFTGYEGRIGIFERLLASGKLKSLWSKGMPLEVMRAQLILDGHHFLRDEALFKVSGGVTSLSEVHLRTPSTPRKIGLDFDNPLSSKG
jgi:type II secretory ATPase GspE/PulE/Tfp pilus assembly ATPase PilB-like protein